MNRISYPAGQSEALLEALAHRESAFILTARALFPQIEFPASITAVESLSRFGELLDGLQEAETRDEITSAREALLSAYVRQMGRKNPSPTQAPETGDPSTPPTQGRGEGSPAPASRLDAEGDCQDPECEHGRVFHLEGHGQCTAAGCECMRFQQPPQGRPSFIPSTKQHGQCRGLSAPGAPGFVEAIVARLEAATVLRAVTVLGQSGSFSFDLSSECDDVDVRIFRRGHFLSTLDLDCLCALLRALGQWANEWSSEGLRRLAKAIADQGPIVDVRQAIGWLKGQETGKTLGWRSGLRIQMKSPVILEYLRRGWEEPKAITLSDLEALLEILSDAPGAEGIDEPRTSPTSGQEGRGPNGAPASGPRIPDALLCVCCKDRRRAVMSDYCDECAEASSEEAAS